MEEKSLMQYLEDINTYKEAIKNAINEKGGEHYMDNVGFSGYAEKIKALQIESGDTPSTPTPSVDYNRVSWVWFNISNIICGCSSIIILKIRYLI